MDVVEGLVRKDVLEDIVRKDVVPKVRDDCEVLVGEGVVIGDGATEAYGP